MVELKGLEEWARGILATSKTELNRRFGTWKRSDEFSKSIEALPFFSRYRPVFRVISDQTLRELHQKLRGQKCEFNFWDTILMFLEHPLPDEIAFDLIDRKVSLGWLEHSPQSDAVFWRLMPEHSDATLTLAKSFYTDSNYDLKDFESILSQCPDREWVLGFVARWSASSLEKRNVFEKSIENHPERELLLNINPEIEPEQKPFSYFDLSRYSESDRMRALYGAYDFEKLMKIARDDQTPDEILHDLEELRDFAYATKIRAAARHTLRRREAMNEQWAIFTSSNAEK